MNKLIPRLSYAELEPALAEALRPKVERLGYLGEFFQCAAHQPRALTSFHRLTEDLKEALPDNLTELVALTVAALMGNAYERVQHERLALKLGFTEAWVREVLSLAAKSGGALSDAERVAQRLVLAVIERRGHKTTDELEAVVLAVGHERAVAVLLLVGRYVMHALVANCLALEPPVGSPLGEKV
jgi:alkylhydroperoxidase family enzyme